MAKAKLEQEQNELRTLLGNGERIKFETTTKEKEFLEEQLQAGGRRAIVKKYQYSVAVNDDQLYWPFQGEFWRDELGTYQYTLTKGCIERKTANQNVSTRARRPRSEARGWDPFGRPRGADRPPRGHPGRHGRHRGLGHLRQPVRRRPARPLRAADPRGVGGGRCGGPGGCLRLRRAVGADAGGRRPVRLPPRTRSIRWWPSSAAGRLLLVINAGGVAAVAVTFARYALELTGAPITETAMAIVTIVGLAAINCLGVRSGSLVQGVLDGAQARSAGCADRPGLAVPPPPPPSAATPADGLLAFGGAMVPVLFAYGGWQTSCFIASEVRDPRRTLPRALMAGVVTVIVLYVGVSWVCLAGLGPAGLAATETPASALMRRTLGAARGHLHRPGHLHLHPGLPRPVAAHDAPGLLRHGQDGLFFRSVARVCRGPVPRWWPSSSWRRPASPWRSPAGTSRSSATWCSPTGCSSASPPPRCSWFAAAASAELGVDPLPGARPPWTTGGFVLVSALVVLVHRLGLPDQHRHRSGGAAGRSPGLLAADAEDVRAGTHPGKLTRDTVLPPHADPSHHHRLRRHGQRPRAGRGGAWRGRALARGAAHPRAPGR